MLADDFLDADHFLSQLLTPKTPRDSARKKITSLMDQNEKKTDKSPEDHRQGGPIWPITTGKSDRLVNWGKRLRFGVGRRKRSGKRAGDGRGGGWVGGAKGGASGAAERAPVSHRPSTGTGPARRELEHKTRVKSHVNPARMSP